MIEELGINQGARDRIQGPMNGRACNVEVVLEQLR